MSSGPRGALLMAGLVFGKGCIQDSKWPLNFAEDWTVLTLK